MIIMETNVYQLDGRASRKMALPGIFSQQFRQDLVRRALLAEQSTRYQPQGHYLLAGMQTTAIYVGRMNAYRSGRHMGQAIRPRQKLGGGSKGDVRRIPSAVKGRRAHPHKIEKVLEERINAKEYRKALAMAVAGTSHAKAVLAKHVYEGKELPIVVEDKMESVAKTKELTKILDALKLGTELEQSHSPKLRKGLRRLSQRRQYRKSILIVANDASKINRAARNIPGVDAIDLKSLTVEKLAPGAMPRLSIWTESAVKNIEKAVETAKQ